MTIGPGGRSNIKMLSEKKEAEVLSFATVDKVSWELREGI